MPVHRTSGGGWQYGPSGKVYYGPGAQARAARQGRAMSISKARAAGHRIPQPPSARKGKARRRRRR